jgi:nicotinate-nucleotide adenylyltransferase
MKKKKSLLPVNRKLKIGLLGGSFNPAHEGHLYISNIALKKLKLDEVWWIVSPQNPLKPTKDMAPFKRRFEFALQFINEHPKILISNFEQREGTTYTVDTLKKLTKKFPTVEFVWLMGADNLVQLPKWKNWKGILRLAHIHVFDRASYYASAIASEAYKQFPEAITYHKIKKMDISSTQIRALPAK